MRYARLMRKTKRALLRLDKTLANLGDRAAKRRVKRAVRRIEAEKAEKAAA